MSTLRRTLETESSRFAEAIVLALRSASIDELMSINGGRTSTPRRTGTTPKMRGGRLGRRTAEYIAQTLTKIVSALAQHPEGLQTEQIRAALGLDKRELPKAIAQGLKSGALKKTGEKRATLYMLGAGDEASPMRTTKKTAKRAAKKVSGKRAAKKKAGGRESKKMTNPEMERSILSFVKDAGPEGATVTEWMQSVGLGLSDNAPEARMRQAMAVWSKLVLDETLQSIGAWQSRKGESETICFLPEDVPDPERVKELLAKYKRHRR
jgi:hypothetical protein